MTVISNPVIESDIKEILSADLDWNRFRNSNILITGINSMIGTYLTALFISLNRTKKFGIKIFGLTRSLTKSKLIFGEENNIDGISYIDQDVIQPINTEQNIDYIFHFAGNASPTAIINDPVGIQKANILGAFNVLELARTHKSKAVLFASTREVYGKSELTELSETSFGEIDPMLSRNCYPESKRAVESIARSYFDQYGVNTFCARIAHSFGPGMKTENDGRVMADFMGDAINGRNIVMLSDGTAERAFIYISDAIIGLMYIVLNGVSGEAYNLSNEQEPHMIRDIAQMICCTSGRDISVIFSDKNDRTKGYCNYKRVRLNNTKLERLGFTPKVSIRDGIKRTLLSFELQDKSSNTRQAH